MVFSVARLTVLAAALFGSISAAPVESPELEIRAPAQVITKCTQPKTVALTFDDGPYVNTKKLVDLLDKNGAKGTWFFNGNNYGCIYNSENAASVKYVYDKGHQVASHTWGHQHLASLSGTALKNEFTKTNTALKKITGADPAFMRPPYGEYDDEVREVASSVGQKVVIWDFDSGDSAGKSAAQSKKAYDDWLKKNPNNVLTLNHETYATTVNDVIPYAIQQFKAKGYKMVTVAQCLGQSPYKSTGSPSPRDSTWKC
ncbi:Carbohydrate esterase 4 protein [Ceratobasidium sp. 428]|nr:Carbohydrate esterase 4 protein [Ceratobasidium sp. 395]KAG8793653.1 Carbohydrate esterase 4 protein [Ceratobasidium sp. 428]